MDELLEKLCSVLDDELERQETVRALCIAQREAAQTRDVPQLDAKSAALQVLVRDAVRAESGRHAVLRELVSAYQLPPERQTLSDLIECAPAPWKARLQYYESRLQSVMAENRQVVRETTLLLRRSLRVVNQSLRVLHESLPGQSQPYTDRGAETVGDRRSALILNQRG